MRKRGHPFTLIGHVDTVASLDVFLFHQHQQHRRRNFNQRKLQSLWGRDNLVFIMLCSTPMVQNQGQTLLPKDPPNTKSSPQQSHQMGETLGRSLPKLVRPTSDYFILLHFSFLFLCNQFHPRPERLVIQ